MADEKQKYENFKTAFGDGKTRAIYIGGLVIVIAVAAFSIWSFSAKKSAPRGAPLSEVPKMPSMQNPSAADAAGKGATPIYDKLVQEQNQREAERAKQEGGSAVPAMRAGTEQRMATQPQPQPAAPQLPQPQPNQGNREEEQKSQQAFAARVQAMKSQVNLLIAAWAPKEHTNLPVVGKDTQRNDAQAQAQAASSAAAAAVVARQPSKKAGDTCYAQLDTAVNTDEPSPVTATIMQCGELDQSKIVGKIEVAQNAQKAVLRFTNINIPGQPASLPMDGVAIDESTRRTALASDVDNHYFLRYGSLFASAFLAGFGDALLKGGQEEQLVTTQTGAVIQRKAYDTKQLVLAGVGNVGKQAGANMGGVFNRAPTIKIDAGIGIGVLFMSDLTLK